MKPLKAQTIISFCKSMALVALLFSTTLYPSRGGQIPNTSQDILPAGEGMATKIPPVHGAESPIPRLRLKTEGHSAPVHALLYSPDGQYLISAGLDKVVYVRYLKDHTKNSNHNRPEDTPVKELRYTIGDGQEGAFYAVAINPINDTREIALGRSSGWRSGSRMPDDSDILIVDYLNPNQVKKILSGHHRAVTCIAYAPDGKTLASGDSAGNVLLWDLTQEKPKPIRVSSSDAYITGVAFTSDRPLHGNVLAFSQWRLRDGEHVSDIEIRQLDPMLKLRELPQPRSWQGDITCLTWMGNGNLAYGADDGTLHIWNTTTQKGKTVLALPDGISCLAATPDNKYLLCGGGKSARDFSVHCWSVEKQELKEEKSFQKHQTTLFSLAIDRAIEQNSEQDSYNVVSADAFGRIWQWKLQGDRRDTASKDHKKDSVRNSDKDTSVSLSGNSSPAFQVAWSEDGRRLGWSYGYGAKARTIEQGFDLSEGVPALMMENGKSLEQWHYADTILHNASRGDLLLTIAENQQELLVRDGEGKVIRRIVAADGDRIRCATFTPAGKVVVGSEQYLRIYDARGRSGSPEWTLEGHEGPILALAVSKNGRHLASTSVDETVRIWDLSNLLKQDSADSKATPLLNLFTDRYGRWVAWTETGYYSASPGGDDLILWQIDHGKNVVSEIRTSYACREQYYRPDVIARLQKSGDVGMALKEANIERNLLASEKSIQQKLIQTPRLFVVGGTQLPTAPDKTGKIQLECEVELPSGTTISNSDLLFYSNTHKLGNKSLDGSQVSKGETKLNQLSSRFVQDDKPVHIPGDPGGKSVPILGDPGGKRSIDVSGASESHPLNRPATRVDICKYTVTLRIAPGTNEICLWSKYGDAESNRYRLNIDYQMAPTKSTAHLLAIGIKTYKNSKLNLNYPDKDVEGIVDIWEKNKKLYPDSVTVKSLVNDQATKKNIMDEIEQVVARAKPEDTIFLYFSCHGLSDKKNGQFYLAPADLDTANATSVRNTGLSWRYILQKLQDARAKRIILLIDHCFSGGVATLFEQQNDPLQDYRDIAVQNETARGLYGPDILVYASSTSTQISYEPENLQHGLFTYYLLEGFKNKYPELVENGYIMLDSLEVAIRKAMNRDSLNLPQRPVLYAHPDTDKHIPVVQPH